NRLASEKYTDRIALTFDEDEELAQRAYRIIYRLRKANGDLRHYIGAVSFADDTFILPLQGIDIFANLTSRWMRARIADKDAKPSPSLDRMLRSPKDTTRGIDLEQEFWDAEFLLAHWAELAWK